MAPETRDYQVWHASYDDPSSSLAWRLGTVQGYISRALDAHVRPVRVISACAGDGRDIVGVLSGRDDHERVDATLLEIHPALAESARSAAAAAGLSRQVGVRVVDAGASQAYVGLAPADVVLLVGIFGNISDSDLWTTITASAQLCAPGASLIWSRGRDTEVGDRDDAVRACFSDAGFTELDHTTRDSAQSLPALGLVRYDGPPRPLSPGQRWFEFVH